MKRRGGMKKIVQDLIDNDRIPPSILVGIEYDEVKRSQFTIHKVVNFYQFFREELIPEIEKKYNVSKSHKDRILFGYSSSAHFSTFTLFQDIFTGNKSFNAFISVSGFYSQNFETSKLEEKISKNKQKYVFSNQSLFIVIGKKQELKNAHTLFTSKLVIEIIRVLRF